MNNTGKLGSALIALLCGGGVVCAQEFIPIPPLAGDTQTYIRGVSGDGSIVVGTSGEYPNERAFYWTIETGSVALETVDDDPSSAVAISADGVTIVGTIDGDGVRWVNGVVYFLEGNVDYPHVSPSSVSAYGHSIGGSAYPPQGPFGIAIRWTTVGMTDLGELSPDAYPLRAYGISDDATTLVGISSTEAFRWTEQTEMVTVRPRHREAPPRQRRRVGDRRPGGYRVRLRLHLLD